MINNFSLILMSSVFILILLINYSRNEHIDTIELRLYRYLLISNFIGLILEMTCYLTIKYLDNSCLFTIIINKIFLAYYVFFTILLFIYVLIISLDLKKFNMYKKEIKNTCIISFLIVFLIIILLPLYFSNGDKIYSYGPAVTEVFICSFILLIMCVIVMIANYKYVASKKYLPLIVFIVGNGIVGYIQSKNPEMTLATIMESIVLFIMYFTIENPDLKMVQQLNIARDQADKANNAKSEFLSSMSHEIRTPLNAIVGFSQALSEEDIPDSAKEEVKDIMSASESLLELVNGILDISKIEANKLEIINNDYRPKEMLHDLVALTKARMGDKNLDLRIKFDETIPDVLYGDKTRVKQIILNLLTNSVKYTKEGFIEFKVNSVIKGNVCRLIVSVEDSGIGIKKENINKLFTKFERLDEQDNVTIEGTGLGLAITKRLIELMNGKIVVQSDYGVGSKFTVSIDQRIVKMKEENVEVKEVVNEESYSDFSDKHILLVDDNMLNLKVAERLLKNYNVNVKSLNNGFDAIDIINNGEKFDLILMDDMMPKLSGVETFKKLKENSNFSIPTVILTANAIEGMKDKYLKEGFDDYLSKPIVKEELNRVLNKFLKESK